MDKVKKRDYVISLIFAVIWFILENIILIFIFNRSIDKQYIILQVFIFSVLYVSALFITLKSKNNKNG